MKKILLLTFLLTIFLVPAAFANGLAFTEITIEVESDKDDGVNLNGGSFDAAPEDDITLEIEVENTFSSDTDGHEIENIDVEITLDRLCPRDFGEELEEDMGLDDLDPQEEDSATFRFKIPPCAEEDTYDLDIKVTGKDDDDNTEYTIDETIYLTIDKNPRHLILEFGEPSPAVLSCDREFTINAEVHNLGHMDSDGGLLIINDALGINKFEFLDLNPGDYDNEDTYLDKDFTFTIEDDVEAGEYDIRAEVEYDRNTREIKRFQSITIEECTTVAPAEPVEEPREETIVIPAQPVDTTDETEQVTVEQQEEEKEGLTTTSTILLIVAVIIGLIIFGLLFLLLQKD